LLGNKMPSLLENQMRFKGDKHQLCFGTSPRKTHKQPME
jgi:hypothetical protein